MTGSVNLDSGLSRYVIIPKRSTIFSLVDRHPFPIHTSLTANLVKISELTATM